MTMTLTMTRLWPWLRLRLMTWIDMTCDFFVTWQCCNVVVTIGNWESKVLEFRLLMVLTCLVLQWTRHRDNHFFRDIAHDMEGGHCSICGGEHSCIGVGDSCLTTAIHTCHMTWLLTIPTMYSQLLTICNGTYVQYTVYIVAVWLMLMQRMKVCSWQLCGLLGSCECELASVWQHPAE